MCDDPRTEEQLLEAYYGCCEDAFTLLMNHCYDKLVRFARCRLRVVQDAEDAVVGMILKVSRTKNSPSTRFNRKKGAVEKWMNAILNRETTDVLRSLAGRWQQSDLPDNENDEEVIVDMKTSLPEDLAIAKEDAAHLRACCDKLPDPYRTVIRLRYWDGQKLDEIAETLGKPDVWVHRRIKKGLDLLLECLCSKIH